MVNLPNHFSVRPETLEMEMYFPVFCQVKKDGDSQRDDLSGNGGDCGPFYSHCGKPEQAENKNRVKDNVETRADKLRDHGK
ncbi:MAG: hypothetical protein LBP81_02555, partial [Treponema sp.]|nr:hypothetical protein [Treponema sp.]